MSIPRSGVRCVGINVILNDKERTRLMEEYNQLRQMVADVEDDVIKAEGGNKAAGTRVRKAMQEIKQAAQTVRIKILEERVEG